MKVFELIVRLQRLMAEHGDLDVLIDHKGLHHIEEADVDVEDTGIILWAGDKHASIH